MKKEILKSLKQVVKYMHESEEKHFEECEEHEKENHVYNHVLVLQKFLNDN
jgi:hypothetical protein